MSESEIDLSKILDCLFKDCITENMIYLIQNNYKTNLDLWNKLCVSYDLRLRGKKPKMSKIQNVVELIDQKGKVTDLVIVYSENSPLAIQDLLRYLSLSKSIKVNIYLAIVDKYGDITYYNLSEVSLVKG